jgi:hypothetical protein
MLKINKTIKLKLLEKELLEKATVGMIIGQEE